MRRGALFLLVLLCGLALVAPVRAQSAIESLTVTLLPQYDDPRLLVLYQATFDAPGEVRLAVPSGVELDRASYATIDGTLEPVEATFEAASDGRFIRLDAPTRIVRLDLYLDVIPNRPERFVDFTLPAQRFDVASLEWVVVFPLDATNLSASPEMLATGTNHFGMEQFEREGGPLPAGESASQSIEWVRVSAEPSLNIPDTEPVEESPLASRLLPYSAVALVFIVGLGLVLQAIWRQRRETT